MKRLINTSTVVYESPTAETLKFENEGILCSSTELDDLQKGTFDFEWEN